MAIKVEIGAGTSGFSRGLAKMEAEWSGFKGKLAKKFSFGEVGKGLMQGLGIGSAQQIAGLIGNAFEMAADGARVMYERTRDTLATTQALIALRASPQQQIKNAQAELKGVRAEIEFQKKAVDDADLGPLLLISPQAAENFKAAKDQLTALLAKEGQMLVTIDQLRIAEEKRQEVLSETSAQLRDQRDLLRNQIDAVGVADRAASRAFKRMTNGSKKPDSEERLLSFDRANLEVEKAKKERELAQLRGIKADNLARIGGGGGVFAPSGGANAAIGNPAQAIVSEARKHTSILQSIDGKLVISLKSGNITLQ